MIRTICLAFACLLVTPITSLSGSLQPVLDEDQTASQEANTEPKATDALTAVATDEKTAPDEREEGTENLHRGDFASDQDKLETDEPYALPAEQNGQGIGSTEVGASDSTRLAGAEQGASSAYESSHKFSDGILFLMDPLRELKDLLVNDLTLLAAQDETLLFAIYSVLIAWFVYRAVPVFLGTPRRFVLIFAMGTVVIVVLLTLVGERSLIDTLLLTPLLALLFVTIYTYLINIGKSILVGACTMALLWAVAWLAGSVLPAWVEHFALVVATIVAGLMSGLWLYFTDFGNKSTEDDPLVKWGRASWSAAKQKLARVGTSLGRASPQQEREQAVATGESDRSHLPERAARASDKRLS